MGSYSLKDTKSGFKTLIYKSDKDVRLHSGYDPIKEAERNISTFKLGRASIIVVSGLALGYHIEILKKQFPKTPIVVLEADKTVIKIANQNNPNLKNIANIVNEKSDLETVFDQIDISDFRGIASYIHRPSHQLNNLFYDELIEDIKLQISSKVSDLLTRLEFEEKWIDNIFSNIHHIYDSTPAASLFGKFKNYPGIIVSAGPSLRKNIHLLKQAKDKVIIVAVDTAVKVLAKAGITPHIVMTIDAQKYSLKHFLGLDYSKTALLADIVSYPAILRDYTGHKIISTTSKYYFDQNNNSKRETTPFMDWIEKYTHPLGDIQSGGSVATSAFDLLLNLGCNKIILVGQDLAYTGREIHCSGTYHNDDWTRLTNRLKNFDTINQAVIRKRKIKKVTSFKNKKDVVSDFVFDLYKGWFEDSAKKVSIPVINATEGGTRIKNCDETELQELINSLPTQKELPSTKLEAILNKKQNNSPEKLIVAQQKLLKNLQEVLSKSLDLELIELTTKDHNEKIFRPLLRKTTAYLNRKSLNDKEEIEILAKEIKTISNKLITQLERSIKNLNKVNTTTI